MQTSLFFRISIKDQKQTKTLICVSEVAHYIFLCLYPFICINAKKDIWNNPHLMLRIIISGWWDTTFTFFWHISILFAFFVIILKNNKVSLY